MSQQPQPQFPFRGNHGNHPPRRSRQQAQSWHTPLPTILTTTTSSRASSLHNNQQHSSDTKSDPNPSTVTTTTTTTATSSTQSLLLVSLAESCKRHATTAHSSSDPTTTTTTIANDDDVTTTTTTTTSEYYCRDSLETLQQLLPKVEDKCFHSVSDVLHLCDFYQDCIVGGFCPHAPLLFMRMEQVLPRVHFLLRHLIRITTPPIITVATEIPCDSQQQQQQQRRKLCQTMAQLLCAIPNSQQLVHILDDLMSLVHDLSLLIVEMQQQQDKNFKWQDLEIVLFAETTIEDTATTTTTTTTFPEENEKMDAKDDMDIAEKYNVIAIQNIEQLVSFHQAIWTILEILLTFRKERSLLTTTTTTIQWPTILEDMDQHRWKIGDSDLYFAGFDGEYIQMLLLAIRQTLLTTAEGTNDPANIATLTQKQESAARILLYIQTDWSRTGVPILSLLQESALLVARAVLVSFQSAYTPSSLLKSVLANLVQNLILVPPRVQGSMSSELIEDVVRNITFVPLCESVQFMQCIHESDDSHNSEGILEKVVLKSIATFVHTISQAPKNLEDNVSSSAVPWLMRTLRPLLLHNLVESAFGLLHCRAQSEICLKILSDIIYCSSQEGLGRLKEIEEIVGLCLNATAHDDALVEPGTATSVDDSSSPAKKRKHNFGSGADPSNNCHFQHKRRCTLFKDGDGNDYWRCIDDELFLFIRKALRNKNALMNFWEQESFGEKDLQRYFPHIAITTSTLRMFLSFVATQSTFPEKSSFAHLMGLIESFGYVVAKVGDRLANSTSINTDTTSYRSLCEYFVSCGIQVGSLPLECVESFEFFSKLSSSTKLLFNRLQTSAHDAPDVMRNTFIGNTMCPSEGLKLSGQVVIYKELSSMGSPPVSVYRSAVIGGVSGMFVDGLSYFFTPVNSDEESQVRRLKALANCMGWEGKPLENRSELEQWSLDSLSILSSNENGPFVRLLLWQIASWLLFTTDPLVLRNLIHPSDSKNRTDAESPRRLVRYLVKVCFADPDQAIRDFASREFGACLAAQSWKNFMAVEAFDDEWQEFLSCITTTECHTSLRHIVQKVAGRFFKEIDCALGDHCFLPVSQFPCALGSANEVGKLHLTESPTSILGFRKSAARALCSICQIMAPPTASHHVMLEQALIRVIRMWSDTAFGLNFALPGICLAELVLLSRRFDLSINFQEDQCLPSFSPLLFRNLLLPSKHAFNSSAAYSIETVSPSDQERQFTFLSKALRIMFLPGAWPLKQADSYHLNELEMAAIELCLESCVPFVLSRFILDQDYNALRLVAGYKVYVLAQKRAEYKNRKRFSTASLPEGQAAGAFVGGEEHFIMNIAKAKLWNRDLENKVQQLCLSPGLIERLIPLVFVHAGQSELKFFTNTVLQNKVTIRQLITSREQLLLKSFVLEIGRGIETSGMILKAMQMAAIAKQTDSENWDVFVGCDPVTVSDWITSHFMYLLVNVVQYKWGSKSVVQRIRSLRSLHTILKFLRSSEASQFMPQLMATVNSALAIEADESCDSQSLNTASLRLVAVQCLDKFVRLVTEQQWETLGQNLTLIVVSLVPIISDENDVPRKRECKVKAECHRCAVSLLEWLSQGELGKKLAPYFAEIPFLPQSASLESMRAHLRSFGVDFDNLQVIKQDSDQEVANRSVASEAGSITADSNSASTAAARQSALRRRLETVFSLLVNESASVRRVVLRHLADLLRANRDLFQALLENEKNMSMKRYLTVVKSGNFGFSRGPVTEMIELLLSRCTQENDPKSRILLATCFGEIGAIGVHRLNQASALEETVNAYILRYSKPPWHSSAHRYELKLVTKQLVAALKAAPTSADQHKIAFTIQQILELLHDAANLGLLSGPEFRCTDNQAKSESFVVKSSEERRAEMNPILVKYLKDSNVFDVVEPFWFSEFHEAEKNTPKQPPFFRFSTSYHGWLSTWCRYMVYRAHDTRKNDWTKFFYACRTALRTEAGLEIAELLLPLLLIDRLCFGTGSDEEVILREMRDALTFDCSKSEDIVKMNPIERQKSVNVIFSVLDLLQYWSEPETDEKFTRKSRTTASNLGIELSAPESQTNETWGKDSAMRIGDLVGAIPFELRAHAAAKTGMHACSLRFLEMASRAQVAERIFGSSIVAQAGRNRSQAAGECPESEMTLMKDALASLNDYETMSSIVDDDFWSDPATRALDSIRQREALRDWNGALQDYERAQQLNIADKSLRLKSLRCLLNLGHFETVLQQVRSISETDSDTKKCAEDISATPVAVEAAWRLGRWETLSELLESRKNVSNDSEDNFQVSLGELMLNLQNQNLVGAHAKLKSARCAVMEGLSTVARESYTRAYDHIVRLQILREIEDLAPHICSKAATSLEKFTSDAYFSWDRRLEIASSSGATAIMNARLALARIAGDSAFEGSLFLLMGKRARKSGLYGIAANSFAQAEATLKSLVPVEQAALKSSLQLQFAKLKYNNGESTVALRILGHEEIDAIERLGENKISDRAIDCVIRTLDIEQHGMDNGTMMEIFVKKALLSTRWMIEGGLKSSSELTARFQMIHNLAPKWEKGHFQYSKYVDSILESRIMFLQGRTTKHTIGGADDDLLRNQTISMDFTCQAYVLLAIKHYAEALALDVKHVYQALPRLLSLWFDLTSSNSIMEGNLAFDQISKDGEIKANFLKSQEEANTFMAKTFRQIPAHAFYTALPQLISRIIHDDVDTAQIVHAILKRVLIRYPAQAMWPMAWIRKSENLERRQIGENIFRDAVQFFSNKQVSVKHSLDVLVTSKNLIDFLHGIATSVPSDSTKGKKMRIKPFKDLTEFVPPIQAALSVSLSCGDSSRVRDVFPRHVPRMRAFNEYVSVMMSKAKPKKLKVYVVSADTIARYRSNIVRELSSDHDIGEIHFLIKQEEKGDLRKDARVQDLNNLCNRIMSPSNSAKGLSNQTRRLHLRTFTVTCLSEDTGLLEWVPHTAALRSLIERTYNPQAPKLSSKRHGRRLTSFNDPQIRINFEKTVQNAFFVSGNLAKATELFEELCLRPHPPLLYWWFVQQFQDPHSWYDARTRFTVSAAVWSAIGHVIGLGDRHSENILVDSTTGDCVHVDFDCIFDKGLNLPKPEVVPFRLTQNMIDAFGPTGSDGIYASTLKATMSVLRENRDTLLSVLEPFVKDPVINWKKHRASQQRTSSGIRVASHSDRSKEDAKQKMSVIDERLRGIYNLRNPNLSRILRKDGIKYQSDEELRNELPLSVEGQVHKLIAEATSHENLVQLYVGWMPWV